MPNDLTWIIWKARKSESRPGITSEAARAELVTTGALVVALLLGTLLRSVNYWALLLLVVTAPIESWLRRTQRSR